MKACNNLCFQILVGFRDKAFVELNYLEAFLSITIRIVKHINLLRVLLLDRAVRLMAIMTYAFRPINNHGKKIREKTMTLEINPDRTSQKRFLKKMKKIYIYFIIFGTWTFLTFTGTVLAAEDPMAAAGILKAKTKLDAPDFRLEDLSGQKVSLRDYQGQVVLLSFWATW